MLSPSPIEFPKRGNPRREFCQYFECCADDQRQSAFVAVPSPQIDNIVVEQGVGVEEGDLGGPAI
jgi:hypothetical protein